MLPRSAISRANYRQCVLSESKAYLRTKFSAAAIMAKDQSKDEPHPKFKHLPLATSGPLECALSGTAILRSPYFNKGSAFSEEERKDFGLNGLLPSALNTLEEQMQRAYQQYRTRADDLAKNTFMESLKEQNQVLYYRLLQEHLKEMFGVIYTPTEGKAIQNYSRLFRKPAGCFLDIDDPQGIDEAIGRWGGADGIDLVVVSDGEQILGIGDQGVGGVLISIAKLVIYTLCAGIHPYRTLPVIIDCGTNNSDLLNDDMYLGKRHQRIRGEQYDDFISKFIASVRSHYPKAYIHCEDFGLTNARRILENYRSKVPLFNDDVQGTGVVTLAGIYGALHVSKLDISEARMLFFGAGTAGTGIADQCVRAIQIDAGKSAEQAKMHIWLVDKQGLLLDLKKADLTHAQIPYARDDEEWGTHPHENLLDIVKKVKPHILVGTSTKPGSFTEEIIKEMAKHVERPIIFPLSNPTDLHEAKPADIYKWTEGKALIATGSPFDPVQYNGTTYEVAECNNSTAFPGIGLGGILSTTRLVSDKMLLAAAKALAAQGPAMKDPKAGLLPDVQDVREISVQIAKAVIKQAIEEGLNEVKDIPEEDVELEAWIREQMWDAEYKPYKRVHGDEASRYAKGEAGVHGTRVT